MTTQLNWLNKLESINSQTIKLGLDRIREVAKRLNVQHFDCPVITVGGTNGKGSCVQFLESILSQEGYCVGTYTSPHLLAFNERICIQQKPVTDTSLCQAFETVEKAKDGIDLTFFEFTTLMALWLFQRANLDVILLEVGMGGRLDAVNIVTPEIAIITSIDIDHTDFLGSSREEIGFEKAGIFRPDRAAICGDLNPPQSVLKYAQEQKASLYTITEYFQYNKKQNSWDWFSKEGSFHDLPLPILPIQNAATALMAITLLRSKFNISDQAIIAGLSKAKLPGRFQIFHSPVTCILDVAHNPAAAKLLADNLLNMGLKGKLHAVVGMLADKDICNTFIHLLPYVSKWFFGNLNIPRGGSAQLLQQCLQSLKKDNGAVFDSVSSAFTAATETCTSDDIIIVFGSFYTVAEIMSLLQ